MVAVAQLVRAPGCGPGGRGFESPRSPLHDGNITLDESTSCDARARGSKSVILCLWHGVDITCHSTLYDEESLDKLEADKDRVFVAPAIGCT